MLKLLKHDIKDSFFEVLILNGILVGLSLLVWICVKLSISVLLSISIFAWIIVFASIFFVMIRAIIKNFYTKLFTNNGYLTLTTPVSVDKILLSKIIVSMLHVLTTIFSMIICLAIIISAILSDNSAYKLLVEVWNLLVQSPGDAVLNIIYALAYILYGIITLLFILILSNTGRLKKHKLLKGVLIYIGFAVISSIFFPMRGSNGLLDFIFNIVLSAGLYFAGRYLIINKLELE